MDLSKIWLFSACSGKELRYLRKALEEVHVPAGKMLCEQGTVGREFFLIVEGKASVRRNNRKQQYIELPWRGVLLGPLKALALAPGREVKAFSPLGLKELGDAGECVGGCFALKEALKSFMLAQGMARASVDHCSAG